MKMKKAVIAVGLAFIVTAVFTGCKKELPQQETADITAKTMDELEPEEGASLTLWTGAKAYGTAIAEAFEKKYGVKVKVEEEGKGTIDKMALSGPAGEGADVYITASDNLEKGLSSGVFMKMSDAVADDVKEKVSDTGVEAVTSDGAMYGVPVSIEVNCMYYNKDLVETPATTLEEIMEKAPAFNNPANNKFYFLCTVGDGYYEYPFVSAGGFRLFGENGNDPDQPGLDTDEYEKGLELMAKLHDVMPITSTDLNNKSSIKSAFMDGTVAYYISGPWDVKQVKESGVNLGITTLPTYNGNPLTPFAGMNCAFVSPYTDYPQAAQLLADFLISDEGAAILYQNDGITALSDTSQVEGLSEDDYLKPFVEQFAHAIPMPSVSEVSYYWSLSPDIDSAVFDGKLTPKAGREKAVEDWKALQATK
jgi:arabinogalactan oligomer/maltooligosaccharide transport system substrate-binding protein